MPWLAAEGASAKSLWIGLVVSVFQYCLGTYGSVVWRFASTTEFGVNMS